MALEKINCTFDEARIAWQQGKSAKLPEWKTSLIRHPFSHFALVDKSMVFMVVVTDKERSRTDWQIVTDEFTIDKPIDYESISFEEIKNSFGNSDVRRINSHTNILILKELYGFKYVPLYDGYVLNINRDWKLFFRNGEFKLNCIENKIGDVVHSKSLGLKIESVEELETFIKFLNLQPQ